MGKQGPCCHCGISTTPLWRNGPPEKPVLCNACGSRWKTKGTLLNYLPMHSGGFGANTQAGADLKWSRGRKGSQKHAEQRSHKRKEPCDDVDRECGPFRAQQSVSKGHEEDPGSILSSGLGMSGSESSVRGTVSFPKMPPEIGPPWDIPSRKRSPILRHPKPIDKLTRSLMSLLLDHSPAERNMSSSASEPLLVEFGQPSLMSSELGLGTIFVRQPLSIAQESESETSSIFTQSKGDESYSESGSVLLNHSGSDKESIVRGKDKPKQASRKAEGGRLHGEKTLIPNKALLESNPYNKRDVLQSCQSPLVFLEMKDIVNFDTFTGLLTEQEQRHLLQFVSSADLARQLESVKSMFNSVQFEGALGNFQQLLSEGMFDTTGMSPSPLVLQHYQQLLAITDLTGSGWIEQCSQLQSRNKRRVSADISKVMQTKEWRKDKLKGTMPVAISSLSKVEEDINAAKGNVSRGTSLFASPDVLLDTNPGSIKPEIPESSNEGVGMDGDNVVGSCFLNDNPYHSGDVKGPTTEGNQYMDIGDIDSGEADSLLFNVPNPMSFQQAELLRQPSWIKTKSMKEEENDGAQLESGGLIMGNTWHTDSSPAEWGMFWNSSCVGLPNGTVLNPGRVLM